MTVQRLVIALDLGGTKVEAALVTADGRLVSGSRHRMPTGRDVTRNGLVVAVRSVVAQARAAAPADAEVAGVGIGSAGPVAVDIGEVSPLNMPGCWDFPIVSIVADIVGDLPIALQLDGMCITLAEHWIGALQGYRNALGMIVSTGVGGGLLLDGRLISGRTGNAGHVGQVRVRTPDAPGANNETTLEGTAAGPNTVRWANENGWEGGTGEELAASYAQGDPVAVAAVTRSGEAIGLAIATVAAVADLEAVAIGGGFSRVTPDLFDIARATLRERSPLKTMRGIVILPSALSDEGPLIGAAGLVHRAELVPSRN